MLVTFTVFIAYILLFRYLYPVFGNSVGAIVFLPIVVAGWKLGSRMGLILAFLSCVINLVLYKAVHESGWGEVLLNSLPAFIASFLVGGLTGWFNKLHSVINEKTFELGRKQNELESEIRRHKVTMENLRWNEALLRTMADASNVGYLVINTETDKILYFNNTFSRMWNIEHLEEKIRADEYKNSELMLQCQALLKDSISLSEPEAARLLMRNKIRNEVLELSDGRIIHTYDTMLENGYENNKRLCVFIDITGHKKIEEELRNSRNFLEQVINSVGDPFFVKDRQHRWILLNDSFASLFGNKINDMLGKTVYDYFPKEKADNFIKIDEHIFETGEEVITEDTMTDESGNEHYLTIRKNIYKGSSLENSFLVGTIKDQTVQKNAEMELIRALTKEKELSELKSEFITTVSHEYRTPLTRILSSAELLEMTATGEMKTQLTGNIIKSVDDMIAMLNDVLMLEKVESGKIECRLAQLEVIGFCRDLIKDIQGTSKNKCPVIINSALESLNAMLDKSLLRHILNSLLSNAIKYSPAGKHIELHIAREEGSVHFNVIDHGIGISERDQSRLFEPFFRSLNIANIQGSGLGLSIAKYLVELHGGKITFESHENTGSSFMVSLPYYEK